MTTEHERASTVASPGAARAEVAPQGPSKLDGEVDAVTIETDCQGQVTAWSEGAQHVFGWSAQERLGASADCLFTQQDLANHRASNEMQCALETGRADDERWHPRKSGAPFWGRSEMVPVRDEAGAYRGFVKRVRDITHERAALAALRADAEFLRSVLAASGDCIKVLDLDAKLIFMSERGQRLMEVSDFNAIAGCAWPDFWQDEGNVLAKAAAQTAKAGGLGHFVSQGSTLAGTPKWWDVQVTPIMGADNRPARLLSVSRDITEARVAEDALRDALNLNTLILNSSRDSIVVLDLQGRTQSVSPGGIEGLEIADVNSVIGRSFARAWTGAEQSAARAALDAARAGGTGRFEGLCATHKGTPKWWDVVVSSLPGTAGRPQQLVAIGRDISAARHAAQLLAVTEDRLRVALSASGVVGTWDWDLLTNLVYGDANYVRIYAFDPVLATTGAPLSEYLKTFVPDDLPGVQLQIDATLASDAPFSSEYRIVHPDGALRWIFARGRVVRDAQGVAVRFAGTSVDITEQKAAEIRQAFLLRLSDRLRALPEPQAVLAAAAEALGLHLRADRVGFGQVQPDEAQVLFEAGYGDGVEALVGSFELLFFGAENMACMRQGLTVVCDDVAADPRHKPENWAPLAVRSLVAVPLIRAGRFRAALVVNCVGLRHWSVAEIRLMEDVAERAWDALQRARAEQQLRVSETRLLTAVAITSLGTFEWDTASSAVEMSARGRMIFGFDADEAVCMDDIFGRMHPQDVQRIRGQAMASARHATALETSYRIVLPGDAVRWIRSVSDSVPVPQGQAVRLVGVFEDVTDRVLAEQTLRTSEQQFRALAQSVPHHVWTASRVGHMDWFNDRAYDYCGVAAGTLEGSEWARAVHPEDLLEGLRLWQAAQANGAVFEAEFRLKRADGVYRWHATRAAAMRGPDGQTVRWVGTTTDIEDQRAAREALTHLNQSLEARVQQQARERDRAWKNSRDLQVIIGADGIIRAANEAWTTLLGWHPDEVVGRHHTAFSQADVLAADGAALLSSRTDGLAAYESRSLHKDGGYRWVSWTSTPEDGLVYASGRHITAEKLAAAELHAAQDQLRQSQKMEAVGQLTGGVAHDFNNLLQVISANLQLMGKHAAGNEKLEQRLAGAQDAVRRGAKLAAQLLAFSRRQALEPKVVNVARFVLGMEDLVRRAIGEAIEIETLVSDDGWNALIDPTQIENAVLNLAINARDAMKGSGKLTLTTSNVTLDTAYAKAHVDVSPGDYVRLAVSDSGCGMTAEVMAQVFEPFFSTKPVGSGTGLGLSMVYGFVKQSLGHVEVRSRLGEGTTMELYLPRTERCEDTVVQSDNGPVVGGNETVLVAEDDEGVRATVVELLLELGYRVLKAKDAASALTVIESGVAIDLLFTDVVMPGTLKSLELARIARQRLPGIAVLFTSGFAQNYAHNVITHGDRLEEGVELLPKPYTREALARRLRQLLARRALQGSAPP